MKKETLQCTCDGRNACDFCWNERKGLLKGSDIGFDLKTPCTNCPFRKTAPQHSGIANSLIKFRELIKVGEFAHTCHMTDERSDNPGAKLFNGKVHHCVGALMMCEKMDKRQQFAWAAVLTKRWDPDKMHGMDLAFDSWDQMFRHYAYTVQGQLREWAAKYPLKAKLIKLMKPYMPKVKLNAKGTKKKVRSMPVLAQQNSNSSQSKKRCKGLS